MGGIRTSISQHTRPRSLRIMFSRKSLREKLYRIYLRLGIQFVKVKIRDSRMWLNLKDRVLSRHYFLHRDYESFEVFLIEQLTQQGMTMIDVGACIGYHTLIGSRCVGNSGIVIAFEPAVGNYLLLARNIQLNSISNVCAMNAAVMDYQGIVKLFLSSVNFGDHRVYDAEDEAKFGETRRESTVVPCVRVDDVLREYGLKADVIKIDVQGAEMAAFRGMEDSLTNPEVVLFCEFWPYGLRKLGSSPTEMLDYLGWLGFSIYEILEERRSLKLVDSNELANRFPDMGVANMICIRPTSVSGKTLSLYIS